jgi:cytochrome b involved in lipid metabolism
MEVKDKVIEFIAGKLYTKLTWNPQEASDDMLIDAIDMLGKRFLTHFESTFINFLVISNQDPQGQIICIETIVSNQISIVFVRGPDGRKNQIQAEIGIKQLKNSLGLWKSDAFKEKKNFCIKNCQLVEIIPEKIIRLEELALHNKRNDCWMALYGKVYNLTQYINEHPGGSAILKAAGKDATEIFNRTHPWVNEGVYKKYFIGNLDKNLKKK